MKNHLIMLYTLVLGLYVIFVVSFHAQMGLADAQLEWAEAVTNLLTGK